MYLNLPKKSFTRTPWRDMYEITCCEELGDNLSPVLQVF